MRAAGVAVRRGAVRRAASASETGVGCRRVRGRRRRGSRCPSPTAARSERGRSRRPAARTRPRGGIDREDPRGRAVERRAPRPPIDVGDVRRARPPRRASSARAAGRSCARGRCAGRSVEIARLAVPSGSDPPAITTAPPARGDRGVADGVGRCATTRAALPGPPGDDRVEPASCRCSRRRRTRCLPSDVAALSELAAGQRPGRVVRAARELDPGDVGRAGATPSPPPNTKSRPADPRTPGASCSARGRWPSDVARCRARDDQRLVQRRGRSRAEPAEERQPTSGERRLRPDPGSRYGRRPAGCSAQLQRHRAATPAVA